MVEVVPLTLVTTILTGFSAALNVLTTLPHSSTAVIDPVIGLPDSCTGSNFTSKVLNLSGSTVIGNLFSGFVTIDPLTVLASKFATSAANKTNSSVAIPFTNFTTTSDPNGVNPSNTIFALLVPVLALAKLAPPVVLLKILTVEFVVFLLDSTRDCGLLSIGIDVVVRDTPI
ncbi:hypothetical protein AQBE111736_13775 [Aquirufa beregesia]